MDLVGRSRFFRISMITGIIAAGFACACPAAQKVADIGLATNADAWQFYRASAPDSSLPRVLLIGDSIVNGYRGVVCEELTGVAAVDTWLTPLHLKSEKLHEDLQRVLEEGPYAVIHFNIGLHGWAPGRIPEGEYEPLLRAYVDLLKRHGAKAKLIWGSTTQITVRDQPTDLDPEHNPTIVTRNVIADRVMEEMGVEVDDLYALMQDKLNLAAGDKYHWKAEARTLQGKQVARCIEERLKEIPPLAATLGEGFSYLGQITPRHAKDISASNWSIGAETMDRDYTIYAQWREYLGPLGAKKARIQSGWAKTETEQGLYRWDWVDEIVLDMVDQGVEPWVCLCYGNPIYPGGGDTGLGGGLIASEEALQAWERYVAAFVKRYAAYVDEWELWNEPRTGRGKGAIQYAQFVVRTAETIRRLQPKAEIMFAAGGAFDVDFAKEVLDYLKQEAKLDLVNTIIYHPYSYNPDSSYEKALGLRSLAKSYAPHIDIRQGENGAPSQEGSFGALSKKAWSEESQAKWALRRLLGDLGREIPSSYFAICDMEYPDKVNYKGLLAINEDKTVKHKKTGYSAVQHLTAIFDNTVKRVEDVTVQATSAQQGSKFAQFAYRGAAGGAFLPLWRSTDMPGVHTEFERISLTLEGLQFEDPIWIDLMSGQVYAMDSALWQATAQGAVFEALPVYDSPVLLVERKEIEGAFRASTSQF